jgi:hypothetical protein
MSISASGPVNSMSPTDMVGISINWADYKIPLASLQASSPTQVLTKDGAYTIAQTDNNSILLYDASANSRLTLPFGLRVPTLVSILQIGRASWTFGGVSGMQIIGPGGNSTSRWVPAHVMLINSTTWVLLGATQPPA